MSHSAECGMMNAVLAKSKTVFGESGRKRPDMSLMIFFVMATEILCLFAIAL